VGPSGVRRRGGRRLQQLQRGAHRADPRRQRNRRVDRERGLRRRFAGFERRGRRHDGQLLGKRRRRVGSERRRRVQRGRCEQLGIRQRRRRRLVRRDDLWLEQRVGGVELRREQRGQLRKRVQQRRELLGKHFGQLLRHQLRLQWIREQLGELLGDELQQLRQLFGQQLGGELQRRLERLFRQ
jgi:hypothetical protein